VQACEAAACQSLLEAVLRKGCQIRSLDLGDDDVTDASDDRAGDAAAARQVLIATVLVKRDGTPWTGNTPAQRVAPFHKILADLQERVTSETLADLPALAGGGWRSAREAASSSSEGLMDRDKVDAGDQDCGTSNPMYPRDNSDDDQIAQVGGDSEEQHAADDDAHWIQPPPLPLVSSQNVATVDSTSSSSFSAGQNQYNVRLVGGPTGTGLQLLGWSGEIAEWRLHGVATKLATRDVDGEA
jgi:hypothetical protein